MADQDKKSQNEHTMITSFNCSKKDAPNTMISDNVEPDPSTVIKTENRGIVNIVPKPVLRLTFKLSPRSKAIELTPEQARELQRQLNQVLGALSD